MTEKKNGLEGLVEDLGLDGDIVEKATDAVKDLTGKVDLEEIGDKVKDVIGKGGDAVENVKEAVSDMLEKTDIDDKIMEKGSELLKGIFGDKK